MRSYKHVNCKTIKYMCFSLIHNERFLSIAVSQPFQIDLYLFERKFFIVVYKITTIWKDWARYIKVHGLGSLHSLPSIGTTYYKNIEISSTEIYLLKKKVVITICWALPIYKTTWVEYFCVSSLYIAKETKRGSTLHGHCGSQQSA